MEARLEIVPVGTAFAFETAARVDRYQLVTGPGAMGILTTMDRFQLQACFKSCAMTTSIGPDCEEVEDLLDEVSIGLQAESDNGFYPTISAREFDDNVWIVIPKSYDTPRLLALSTQSSFASQVASWIEAAKAEVSEER